MDTGTIFKGEFWRGRNVILGCLLGMMMSYNSIFFYSSGLFLKPLAAEFGWGRGAASLGILVPLITAGILSPFTGRLIDRYGAFRMALLSAVGLSLSFLLLGIATVGLLSFLALTFLLALLSNATSPLSYGRFVLANFPRHLGLAYGIVYIGPGLGALVFPPLVTKLMSIYAWRGAYVGLAIVVLVSVPIIALLLKNQSARNVTDAGTANRQWNWSLYTDRQFVLLAAIFLFASTGIFGTVVHLVPMLTDIGLSPAKAAEFAALMGFAVIAGRLITGFLLDRIEANLLAATIFALSAGGIMLLATGNIAAILPGILVVGFSIGSEIDLAFFIIGRRFPSIHFSTFFGGILFAVSIGGSLGPTVAGILYDAAGNYLPWFVIATTSMVGSSILCLVGRRSSLRYGVTDRVGQQAMP
ncbi:MULTISPECIES: MFS transporter [unclassified Bradyrhizobium]|uniref:MFS transporter n=1 Tax=unclassified Bradyrhizobium TaxID=2631580 RepID=UPI001FF947D1|nr:MULTISPECIES: MFS transporter [unclassified Bradyrhizobium]MCK1277443.1 MFS transporter [Bradyrhizobium sp. 61]MCK1441885.1 MFS transporter [Bradyrhizobium sp. 48]MCK1465640.1 MFS transporter [Bradyrhizobium sp. 2]